MEETNLFVDNGENYSIYLQPDTPFWFVPSLAGDELLKLRLKGKRNKELIEFWASRSGKSLIAAEIDVRSLFHSIKTPPSTPYRGRKPLRLEQISELWFHLTDLCNLKCGHCLFRSVKNRRQSLAPEVISSTVEKAHGLGCRLVCFTGGEPFMHPQFLDVLRETLRFENIQIATLTNGILIPDKINQIQKLDYHRMHFQVSLDGPEEVHDLLRGNGTFKKTVHSLKLLKQHKIPCSIAMAVNTDNVSYMPDMVSLANALRVGIIHFLWHFKRGMGESMEMVPIDTLTENLRAAVKLAKENSIVIDNLEALRAQVFTPPGTRFDFGNAGWESLAIGPDGSIYPTPAMVHLEDLRAGYIEEGIEEVWEKSAVLKSIREISLLDIPEMASDLWRFIIGGGDLDHCLINGNGGKKEMLLSPDPYAPLYRYMSKMIIEEEARTLPLPGKPGLILKMGDISTECPSGADVNFTHCNCLLSLGGESMQGLVREFYADRAETIDSSIVNPVRYDEEAMKGIPEEALFRAYGCGSPVRDAGLNQGEIVVDLGCGTGVECFLASKEVGSGGKVIGIDMTDAMLDIAHRSKKKNEKKHGYSNTSFVKGLLELIPLRTNSVDVVISNCVLNLTHNKRRVFQEILRILKPGGRMVISDVVTESEPSLHIRSDHELTGECIGGAMVQEYLFSVLEEIGFRNSQIIKRFPYRIVQGHRFYSLTFLAVCPEPEENLEPKDVLYAGPFRAIITEDGTLFQKGARSSVDLSVSMDLEKLGEGGVFTLDSFSGEVTNIDAESTCSCFTAPEADTEIIYEDVPETGCLLCGEPLVYLAIPEERICARCGKKEKANAICEKGHFICDLCHIQDPLEVIKRVCTTTRETDMIKLLQDIRSHGKFPMHGPEHHAMVPGIILATYKNLGGSVIEKEILAGIDRGQLIPGGSCAFMGICGAATGVGIAFSIILHSNPLAPKPRQTVQSVVSKIIEKISRQQAARCCQRECYLALTEASRLSEKVLPLELEAEASLVCNQYASNRECIKKRCLLYPEHKEKETGLKASDLVIPAIKISPATSESN